MSNQLTDPQAIAQWLRAHVSGELHCDSRRVRTGDGFVAWPGAATDGRQFVHTALQAGAPVALVEHEGADAFGFDDERVLAVPGLKRLAGAIAAAFYGQPSEQLDVLGITGTNGKTSTAWWTAQLLGACAQPCAVVGTLGLGLPDATTLQATGLTTPDPFVFHGALRRFVDQGLRACTVEASSIGLVEGRLNATRIRVAVFTNFTQDHLDFHGDMDAYWKAKSLLFAMPGLASAVVNIDDAIGPDLAADLTARQLDVWTVGFETVDAGHRAARLSARAWADTEHGMRLTVVERDAAQQVIEQHPLQVGLVGRYNASNLLCVLAAARALGVPLAAAVHACTALTPVPGRMQRVSLDADAKPLVLVDYAHTPDALEKALLALQPVALRRGGALWVVVGCGGNRDASKRPLMAAAAERCAQRLVFTSDNPRNEEPQAIVQQMLGGLKQPALAQVQLDRALAIRQAVHTAKLLDVVLVAGKGHEEQQEVRGMKTAFSDAQQVRDALANRPLVPGVAA